MMRSKIVLMPLMNRTVVTIDHNLYVLFTTIDRFDTEVAFVTAAELKNSAK